HQNFFPQNQCDPSRSQFVHDLTRACCCALIVDRGLQTRHIIIKDVMIEKRMSSTGPTHQALSNILNNTDSAPSQRQCRDHRPSEKALYQVEEDQERREARRRPSGQEKIKATRKNRVDRGTHDSTQFSTQAIHILQSFSNVEPWLWTCQKAVESMPANHWPVHLKPVLASLSRTSVS
ncbi:hypothetical protein DFJ58DRAFT_125179, partial [Suillus subalutaceus]|uniref:uncharacterized protein n=1 Tax=Suillus subalutaceus TaxID=48586 RepID=UPI001B8765E9